MRFLAYLFGGLLLLDGIPAIFSPHFWVRYSERNLGDYLPKPVLRTVSDFGSLSADAVRTKALAEIMVGMMLFFMASMVSSLGPQRGMGMKGMGMGMGMPMGGPMGMGMRRHSHPHGHLGMNGEHTHPHGFGGHHEEATEQEIDPESL